MNAEQKRNKRKFRHQMQAEAEIPFRCKQFMTNGQLYATRKLLVDRFFSFVKAKASAVDSSPS